MQLALPRITISKFIFPAALIGGATIVLLNKPILLLPLMLLLLLAVFLKKTDYILYLIVIVAFSRLDAWMTTLTGIPCGSLIVGLMVLSLLVIFTFTDLPMNIPNQPFLLLFLVYASSLIIGIFLGSTKYFDLWMRDSLYAFLSFSTIYLLVSSKERLKQVIQVVIFCGIILSIINILELLFPESLRLSHSMGRAAGLLKNANYSAFAIICCYMLFNLYIQKTRESKRTTFIFVVQALLFIGVLSTFSREGVVLLIIIFIINNMIDSKSWISVSLNYLSAILTIAVSILIVDYLWKVQSNIFFLSYNKLYALAHGNIDDNYRLHLLQYYLSKFLMRPLTGFGFNATIQPSAANIDLSSQLGVLGPHNTPVTLIVEFGLFPLIFYILFYVTIIFNIMTINHSRTRNVLLVLAAALILHNLFAHDILLTRFIMIMLGILCVYPVIYSKEKAKLADGCAE